MSRNKLTNKCIGENTKNIFEKQNKTSLFNSPSSSDNFFNRFFNFQFISVSTYMSGLDTI